MLAARENVPVLPSRSLFNEPISDGANSKTIVSRKKIILELCAFRDHEIQRSNAIPHFCIEIGRGIGSNSQPLTILFHSTYPLKEEILKERFVSFFLTLFNFWEIFPFSENVEIWRDDILSRNSEISLKNIVQIRYLCCSFKKKRVTLSSRWHVLGEYYLRMASWKTETATSVIGYWKRTIGARM